MTEDELRKRVAGGHQPEVFMWRVDFDEDRPPEWAVVADDEDLTLPDGSRRQFGNLADLTTLLIKMGIKKIQLHGAEMKLSNGSGPNAIELQEIEGLDDATIEENLKRIGFKPKG